MSHFGDKLISASEQKQTVLVVGLDPQIELMPRSVRGSSNKEVATTIIDFNKIIIDAVAPYVAAIKPQLAYYEVFGSAGIFALEETIKYAKAKGLLIINDAKRGDIGPTAEAYARAFLSDSPMSGDAVTVNPFLGSDGIIPFVQKTDQAKGIFLLLKTSNPSSGELQDLRLDSGDFVYQEVATLIKQLSQGTIGTSGFSSVGAVVGATYPEIAKQLREDLPETLFLVPGYGAQGGNVQDLSCVFNADGNGAVISSTRAIIYSYMAERPEDWESLSKETMKEIIEAKAIRARDELNGIR
ncbi:orotidine-5'-phosphate decarboxylase [Sporosarcina sp. NPDC096371]|uniref:orotidine-5'-phosphate decarboxylase n=1 Tax=Sporosarcina sp. NPDC096371 TaxID=3364530 RepID=UPI003821D842